MKPDYKKYVKKSARIDFSDFVSHLMTFGDIELSPWGQKDACRMAPSLYDNEAIVALIELWYASWFVSDSETNIGKAALKQQEAYGNVLRTLLFCTTDMIESYYELI